jgi:hypothetical protein
MISVESIAIREFRGIRDLTLDFKGRNFAICGPNGTGKSGVVDALEFALTGSVSRLSGEGRGDVSLKQHGPHVDSRNDPGKARVTIKVLIHSLHKIVTIERNLKTPAEVNVTPNDPAVLAALQQVAVHSEFVLSRRELIRYVLATPGKRAEEVQALLHLDQVEKVRGGLQKIANSCDKELIILERAVAQARENLMRVLSIPELTKEKVLTAVNAQRAIIGLHALTDITGSVSIKDGMATSSSAQPQRIPKSQAIVDIHTARKAIAEIMDDSTRIRIAEVTTDLIALGEDPVVMASVQRETLYTTGMELIETEACPFCDMPWNLEELRNHVQVKIDHLKEISHKRKAVETKITPLIATIRKVQGATNTLAGYAPLMTPFVGIGAFQDFDTSCRVSVERLTAILPFAKTISSLTNLPIMPQALLDSIDDLEKAVVALPESSKQDSARDWLTVAQERHKDWCEAVRKQRIAKEQAEKAHQVYSIYASSNDTVLTGIYAAVEKDFEALYRFVNSSDEDKFEAKLIPSIGKLGFDVDFYDRGFFPPGAYHSEGHQDSMGLCLYLALMRHLQGDAFTFAVLDDVLMSVDVSHRREVCTLLKNEFPNTQFVMTTHDLIWLRHMKTEKLIDGQAAVQFKGWDINQGPTRWDDRDVWTEIDDYLKGNDVRSAAGLLRHYLEYTSCELCHRLRAFVEFRGDVQYQLGELLPAAIKRMRYLYKCAKEAANSWNQQDVVKQIADCEAKFAAIAGTSNAEQWQVNAVVHYNSWDNLGKQDFEPVVSAFKDLLNGFMCQECREYLRVLPDRGTSESVCCKCGKTAVSLSKKN